MMRTILLLAFAMVCCAGCAKEEAPRVRGGITLNGVPLTKVHVVLWPVHQPAIGYAALQTDDQGRFDWSAHAEVDRLSPGDYRILVRKDDADRRSFVIPAVYQDCHNSPLTRTVGQGVSELGTIDLPDRLFCRMR